MRPVVSLNQLIGAKAGQRKPPRYRAPDDAVSMEIEGVGVLENREVGAAA